MSRNLPGFHDSLACYKRMRAHASSTEERFVLLRLFVAFAPETDRIIGTPYFVLLHLDKDKDLDLEPEEVAFLINRIGQKENPISDIVQTLQRCKNLTKEQRSSLLDILEKKEIQGIDLTWIKFATGMEWDPDRLVPDYELSRLIGILDRENSTWESLLLLEHHLSHLLSKECRSRLLSILKRVGDAREISLTLERVDLTEAERNELQSCLN